ncbi:MAG: component of the polarisome [Pycnora praestabilis]|nr:MAG: component of the polarisome [Pycnora praestabilis]
MNGRSHTLSPISVDGSEWSGISKYQSINTGFSPDLSSVQYNRKGAITTPPISGSSNGMMNGMSPSGMARASNTSPGNPSPPSSVARSSVGTGLSSEGGQNRRALMLEERLSEHYTVLKRYLAPSLRDEKGNPRPNRARDKLLRLSAVQFQELSTDVYDELLRRQSSAGQGPNGPAGPSNEVPGYLLPKDTFHPKRNQARQKLSTLPSPRFRDLATDVFFELERRFPRFVGGDIDRVGSPVSVRGPPSRNGTPNMLGQPGARRPPPRIQEGSESSLPPPYSRIGGPRSSPNASLGIPGETPQNEYGRPVPKTFQSNTIIPNKSTLVEDDGDQTGPDDDDDDEGDAFGLEGAAARRESKRNTSKSFATTEKDKKAITEYQSQVTMLEEKIDDLEARMREKDEQLSTSEQSEQLWGKKSDLERKKWSELESDLSNKLAEAQNINDSLKSELDRLQTSSSDTERKLRTQLDQASNAKHGGSDIWQDRYDSLEREHNDLKNELGEQQHITEEVKHQASGFLNEMKSLSDRSGQSWEREEHLLHQVSRLEQEVKEWKGRYARTKSQLRIFHASSMGMSIQQQNAGQYARDGGFTRPDGLVKDVHVTRFQMSIDELLRMARTGEPSSVLEYMKSVVASVRQITQDVDEASASDDQIPQLRSKLKIRVSATANNLITASKNFSASNGVSPVSLLDAAASHLSAAVVELIRMVKIRPVPDGEDNDTDEESVTPRDSMDFSPIPNGRASSDSVYSSMTSPRDSSNPPRAQGKDIWTSRRPGSRNELLSSKGLASSVRLGFGHRTKNKEVEDLKVYLEDQTEGLVHSIQSLVSSVRADLGMRTIRGHMNDIAMVVQNVVASTETAMNQSGSTALRDQSEPIVRTLADCRTRLLAVSADGEEIRDPTLLKEYTNKLPPLAFEIARETKELAQRIDRIESEARDDDDF